MISLVVFGVVETKGDLAFDRYVHITPLNILRSRIAPLGTY